MKQRTFLLRLAVFVVPFFLSFGINSCLYTRAHGDLLRMIGAYKNALPKQELLKNAPKGLPYAKVSAGKKSRPTDVLTIGDSFFEQGEFSVQAFLQKEGMEVLHIDGAYHDNPMSTLLALIESGFVDSLAPRAVILESVERKSLKRIEDFPKYHAAQFPANTFPALPEKSRPPMKFFASSTVKAPVNALAYTVFEELPWSEVLRLRAQMDGQSSGPSDHMYCFKNDHLAAQRYAALQQGARMDSVFEFLGGELNRRGISLYILIAPDKYSYYYPFLEHKEKFTPPLMLAELAHENHMNYTWVPAMEILSEVGVDAYFYDDTHWTPKSAQAVAQWIQSMISTEGDAHHP